MKSDYLGSLYYNLYLSIIKRFVIQLIVDKMKLTSAMVIFSYFKQAFVINKNIERLTIYLTKHGINQFMIGMILIYSRYRMIIHEIYCNSFAQRWCREINNFS